VDHRCMDARSRAPPSPAVPWQQLAERAGPPWSASAEVSDATVGGHRPMLPARSHREVPADAAATGAWQLHNGRVYPVAPLPRNGRRRSCTRAVKPARIYSSPGVMCHAGGGVPGWRAFGAAARRPAVAHAALRRASLARRHAATVTRTGMPILSLGALPIRAHVRRLLARFTV
jgi:hypothetical protein